MSSSVTVEQLLKQATEQLTANGSESPSLDAAVLLCHALNKPRSFLFTWPDKVLSEEEQGAINDLISERLTGKPVAYIVGEREFWSLPLKVSPSTLIPRPDTERLVEVALDLTIDANGPILDLGTGTGAIALALASEMPNREVIGVDLREEAQQLATENSKNLSISNARFVLGSWFEPIGDLRFDLIVSNPPYIDEQDPHLDQGDVRFEPKSALVADDKGMADIRWIATNARSYLNTGGWIAFEHGYDQGKVTREFLESLGYSMVATQQDYAGNDRVTLGKWNG
ncbi:peptide chain release factor N(5)-glutamine methyltransferase [Vibrio maerlii]|uniref:peptide chain release factor N(5)-glutamine methyltransferase n=1 Tax=Vibrio maerlii TaxID=2231648 RepID=UPI000E3ED496|nr:peptide chain release factor N(5)-glutamine methyltransferase [Vibrio maerlii]